MDVPWLMTVASDRRQYLIKSSWLNHHKIDFSLSLSLRKSGTHTKKSISSHELGLSINLLHRCLRVLLFFFLLFLSLFSYHHLLMNSQNCVLYFFKKRALFRESRGKYHSYISGQQQQLSKFQLNPRRSTRAN